MGIRWLWQSALPATAGGHSGLLWLMYYIPRGTAAVRRPDGLDRNCAWMSVALALSAPFLFVLGRGVTLHR
jgi:hypothetical protein